MLVGFQARCSPFHSPLPSPSLLPFSRRERSGLGGRRAASSVGTRKGVSSLRAMDFSVEGLQFIIITSGLLALASTWMQYDNSDVVTWISEKALGEKLDGSPEEVQSVRNPITGRMIKEGGSTHTKLKKKGIMFEGEGSQASSKLDYRTLVKGTGVGPLEGSIAVVHLTFRKWATGGREGDLIYSTLSTLDKNDIAQPFVFEVGDPSVVRGLNEAVVGMTEGEEGIVKIPPALGYSSQRRHPTLSNRRYKEVLRDYLQTEGRFKPLLCVIELLAVLAPPPTMLSGGAGPTPPPELSKLVEQRQDGVFQVREEG